MDRSKGRRNSRSRSRDKRDRRSESRERDRGRGDHREVDKNRNVRDRSERDRFDRGNERDRNIKSTRENDSITTSSRSLTTSSNVTHMAAGGGSSIAGGLKDKASMDKLRRERLELVKRLTQTDDDIEVNKTSSGLRIFPQKDANGIVTFKSIETKVVRNKSNTDITIDRENDDDNGHNNDDDNEYEEGDDDNNDDDGINEVSEEDMMAMMGFSGFNTTKDKPHDDNLHSAAVGAVSKHKKRKYRQYMNRRGGFNRPLQHME